MSKNLTYTSHDGLQITIEGLSLTQDNTGRYWLWSGALEQNLAYKIKTREDALLAALDSTLFLLSLKQEKIDELSAMRDKVRAFLEDVQGDENEV